MRKASRSSPWRGSYHQRYDRDHYSHRIQDLRKGCGETRRNPSRTIGRYSFTPPYEVADILGGIANVCFIPPDSEVGIHKMIDWDCGH